MQVSFIHKKCKLIFICINFMQEYLKSLEIAVKTDIALPDQYDAVGYREQDWTTGKPVKFHEEHNKG